ncbi:UNVERIFIED_ORG: hypothetical protein E4P37_03445 [Bacillus sp. AZ43]
MRTDDAVPWAAVVARLPLDRATHLVAGHIADRADGHGRVRSDAATIAAACCLPITAAADALANLASRCLVARDGHGHLVLMAAEAEGGRR